MRGLTKTKHQIRRQRPPAERPVKSIMVKARQLHCRLSNSELADLAGISVGYLQNQISNGFKSRHARVKVEQVLGMAIWSTEEKFNARRAELESMQGQTLPSKK